MYVSVPETPDWASGSGPFSTVRYLAARKHHFGARPEAVESVPFRRHTLRAVSTRWKADHRLIENRPARDLADVVEGRAERNLPA